MWQHVGQTAIPLATLAFQDRKHDLKTHQGHKSSSTGGRFSKEQWVEPFIDTSKWEYFDLSCKSRDETNDKAMQKQMERLTMLYSSLLFKIESYFDLLSVIFLMFWCFFVNKKQDKRRTEMNSVLATFSKSGGPARGCRLGQTSGCHLQGHLDD